MAKTIRSTRVDYHNLFGFGLAITTFGIASGLIVMALLHGF